MIVGSGIDLIANSQVQQELARDEWQSGEGVFTAREIRRCKRAKVPSACYAACFAAKEATLKALGVGIGDIGVLREVAIETDPGGSCRVDLHIWLSIASGKQHTAAMVILES
jgi:holo-[acyl-carrier protein] synthase